MKSSCRPIDEGPDDEEDGHGELEDDEAVAQEERPASFAGERRALQDVRLLEGGQEEGRIEPGQESDDQGQAEEPRDDERDRRNRGARAPSPSGCR